MPQKREIARPAGSAFVTRVPGPIPAGSVVSIDQGDVFYGLRFGSCEVVHDKKGKHTVAEDLDGGWYILRDGVDTVFEEDLGVMADTKGTKGRITVKGTLRMKIDEPRDFAASQNHDIDLVAVSERTRAKVRQLIDDKIIDVLAGDRYLTSLQSSKIVDGLKKDVLAAWTGDGDRDTFIAIEIPKLEIRSATIEEPPPPSAEWTIPEKDPVPPPPPSFVAGDPVDVRWADGNKYPATVRAMGCLVQFPDGQEHWIPIESITPRS
jgi:hypothetical protein